MGAFSKFSRAALCCLAGGLFFSVSAFAQSPVPEGFCPQLTKIVVALSNDKTDSLKGKRLSKTEWEGREDLPGMNGCKLEADTLEETGGDSMMKALTSETVYQCEIAVERQRVDASKVKNVEEFKQLNREAALDVRGRATKVFEAFDGAISACIPGMTAERSVGEIGLFKGLPKVVFKKKDQSDIQLWIVHGLKNLRVELRVEDHFFRGK